jgi:DNA-binding CsgD family transcriptional regulator
MNEFLAKGHIAELLTEDEWDRVCSAFQLSERQEEVLRCVFESLTDKQIAHRLHMRLATVRTHMTRLRAKMGANNRLEISHQVWELIHVKRFPPSGVYPLLKCNQK